MNTETLNSNSQVSKYDRVFGLSKSVVGWASLNLTWLSENSREQSRESVHT